MEKIIINLIIYLSILMFLAAILGKYIAKVFSGEKVWLSFFVTPIEKKINKFLKIDEKKEMNGKEYVKAILIFSFLGFLFLFIILITQQVLPFNSEHLKNLSWDTAINTAVSFVTNTNWQSYSGETALGYLSQAMGLTVQNFLSAAVGITVLIALIRGFIRKNKNTLGNFWGDLVKSVLYILMPLSIVVSFFLMSQGVVQSFKGYEEVKLVEPILLTDGQVIDSAQIPLGPAASQIAIKQLGTNGGGFFSTNSAHPFENPTALSNLVEVLSIVLIPAALCFTFGYMVKDKKQGRALLMVMTIIFTAALAGMLLTESIGATNLMNNPTISTITDSGTIMGNMEGKELRFGLVDSSFWTVATTAASSGSVNSMIDSYTPMGYFIAMLLMQLGEVIFGGVGSGLYGMIAFVIMAVFVAGLMVGRTPEYLGKKIEAFEMRMASLIVIIPPIMILIGTAFLVLKPEAISLLGNTGPHGFSEILYALSSAGNNNGSAMAGLNASTVFMNLLTSILMIVGRFLPMILILATAGALVKKKKIPTTAGTLETNNLTFIILLIIVILIIGALSFLPTLALGPIAELIG